MIVSRGLRGPRRLTGDPRASCRRGRRPGTELYQAYQSSIRPVYTERTERYDMRYDPYRLIHTGLAADRYADQAVPLRLTVGSRFRSS
ncbi:hypothetical protein BHM03_00050136 [Ensete ventricosum]|nr:hypothetical protein BHM03_00050136 [Ensete ventricosum]